MSLQQDNLNIIRMDAMEIDDSIYIKKNFAMDGLGSQGTISPWIKMDECPQPSATKVFNNQDFQK